MFNYLPVSRLTNLLICSYSRYAHSILFYWSKWGWGLESIQYINYVLLESFLGCSFGHMFGSKIRHSRLIYRVITISPLLHTIILLLTIPCVQGILVTYHVYVLTIPCVQGILVTYHVYVLTIPCVQGILVTYHVYVLTPSL